MQKQKRRSMREKLVNAAELPRDITLGLPKITILAGREVTVENHRGIIEYDENTVRLSSDVGILTIRGTALSIASITDDDIVIAGAVHAFEGEGSESV